MIVFYIEDAAGQMMEEKHFSPQYRTAVRGNVGSFLLDWATILKHMQTQVESACAENLPHDGALLAQIVRFSLRLKENSYLPPVRVVALMFRTGLVRSLQFLNMTLFCVVYGNAHTFVSL